MIDLHLHLDGSLPPETVIKLAMSQGINLPSFDKDELIKYLRADIKCGSLNDYLEKFDLPLALLQKGKALETAVYDLMFGLKENGITYAEIRFAPQLHTRKELTQEDAVVFAIKGMEKGIKETGVKAKLILCLMRGDNNKESNIETVHMAEKFLGKGVCALDLAGAEALYPTENFRGEFELARRLNIPFTIHAGEAAGPESVWEAVRMGARRIGHGVNAVYDEELLMEIKKRGIVLETCPTSNIQTGAVSDIKLHPVKKLLNMGIKVTVNTDNMTVSDTTVSKEFMLLKREIGLTPAEEAQLLQNAEDACF